MDRGGEHHHQHQPEDEARLARKLDPAPAIPSVGDYINVLDEALGYPWQTPTTEGFRWFLADAIGVDDDQLSPDEQRLVAWLASWDHWTVQVLGQLIHRARAQAQAEGRAAMEDAR